MKIVYFVTGLLVFIAIFAFFDSFRLYPQVMVPILLLVVAAIGGIYYLRQRKNRV